jgi:hypothetical protein
MIKTRCLKLLIQQSNNHLDKAGEIYRGVYKYVNRIVFDKIKGGDTVTRSTINPYSDEIIRVCKDELTKMGLELSLQKRSAVRELVRRYSSILRRHKKCPKFPTRIAQSISIIGADKGLFKYEGGVLRIRLFGKIWSEPIPFELPKTQRKYEKYIPNFFCRTSKIL